MKINSTITLTPTDCDQLTLKQTNTLLSKTLKDAQKVQTRGIKDNLSTDCTQKTKYSNAAARKLTLNTEPNLKQTQKYQTQELNRTEVYRILSNYQQRLAIAKHLQQNNWLTEYKDRPENLKYTKQQYWENTKRAQKLPRLPKIESPIIPLSKSAPQYSRIDFDSKTGVINLFLAAWDKKLNLTFQIPKKLLQSRKNITKITRPNIRFDQNKKPVFDFTIEEEITLESTHNNSVIAVDLGKAKLATHGRQYSNEEWDQLTQDSIWVKRDQVKYNQLTLEIDRLATKNKKREALGFENVFAVRELELLRSKRENVSRSLEWQVAVDVVSSADSGERIVLEKLSFNQGGSQFKSRLLSSKIEHVAVKCGKTVVKVNAAFTSQKCPVCESFVENDSKTRVAKCVNVDCRFTRDRDDLARLNIGQRGLKSDRSKSAPTPKRARVARSRRKFLLNNVVGASFTGLDLSSCTQVLENLESVVTKEVNCSKNLYFLQKE